MDIKIGDWYTRVIDDRPDLGISVGKDYKVICIDPLQTITDTGRVWTYTPKYFLKHFKAKNTLKQY